MVLIMTIISTANKSEEDLKQILFKPIKDKIDECPLPILEPAEAKVQLLAWDKLERALDEVFHTIHRLPLKPEHYSVTSEYKQASIAREQFTALISSIKPYIEEHQLRLDLIIRGGSDAT
tara:strand:+ start:344 stop:703 length:360 start_codon:yes stop_codon:yes gene_type:complete